MTRRPMFLVIPLAMAPVFAGEPQSVGDSPVRTSVLPVEQAVAVYNVCREKPPSAEAAWLPSAKDIELLESDLNHVFSAEGASRSAQSIDFPELYCRQYVGLVLRGRRFIYINAARCLRPPDPEFFTKFLRVCDGSTNFWGALYDTESGHFSHLSINGL